MEEDVEQREEIKIKKTNGEWSEWKMNGHKWRKESV